YYLGKRLQVQKDTQNRATGFTAAVPHAHAVIDIKEDILRVESRIGTWINDSLNFGLQEKQALIDTADRDQIRKYVKYLSANDQAKFNLGLPKTKLGNYKPRLARIRVVTLALLVCFEKRVTKWLAKLPLHLAISRAIDHVNRLYIRKIQIT